MLHAFAPLQVDIDQSYTRLFIFPNFYIINLPTIIAIQFFDGVGENIVKLYKPVYRIIQVYTVSQFSHLYHRKILYIIDRVWKAGLFLKNHRKYPAV